MDNLSLVIIEIISAALAFVLVRFMIKPYRMTGEARYLGLPLGFAFLGMSYIFMGTSLFFSDYLNVERMQWLQLFTGAYAYVFLAITYYFSAKVYEKKINLLMQFFLSFMFLVFIIVFIVIFIPPVFELPDYKTLDEYFRISNMILALYVTICTLRVHARKPDQKTIMAPLGYTLLAFSQYSFLVWSLDASYSAFIGAHIIRFAGLFVFLYVSYKAIIARE